MKLLLGCGNKKREGWLNVDIDKSVNPDIVGSATSLPIESSSVDVIESQHMFEHLFLIEKDQALNEWYRVLKPGGKIIIEMPNLDRCCELILQNEPGTSAYISGYIGIFGHEPSIIPKKDRSKDNLFMLHKSGWSPRSIKCDLESYGFENIREVEVLQKYRPAYKFNRDFRIEGIKK